MPARKWRFDLDRPSPEGSVKTRGRCHAALDDDEGLPLSLEFDALLDLLLTANRLSAHSGCRDDALGPIRHLSFAKQSLEFVEASLPRRRHGFDHCFMMNHEIIIEQHNALQLINLALKLGYARRGGSHGLSALWTRRCIGILRPQTRFPQMQVYRCYIMPRQPPEAGSALAMPRLTQGGTVSAA
jgi:hypothetical protein